MPPGQTCSPCRQVPVPSPPLPDALLILLSTIGVAKSCAISRSPSTRLPIIDPLPPAMRRHPAHVRPLLQSTQTHRLHLHLRDHRPHRPQGRVSQERRRLRSLQVCFISPFPPSMHIPHHPSRRKKKVGSSLPPLPVLLRHPDLTSLLEMRREASLLHHLQGRRQREGMHLRRERREDAHRSSLSPHPLPRAAACRLRNHSRFFISTRVPQRPYVIAYCCVVPALRLVQYQLYQQTWP